MSTASKVLEIARGELGYSRWNDPEAGTKYGRWYAQLVGNSYFGQSGVPYCAMFVSWVFAHAGATCSGVPGAYCPTMLNVAKSSGAALSNVRDCQPGDVVYFDWDGGVVDHVGIVEINQGSYIQTIEGNTGNGQVLRRTRNWSTVSGVVRPSWGQTSAPTVATPSVTPTTSSIRLDVDGWWGPNTTRRLQQYLGTPQDGIVSGQDSSFKSVNKGGLLYSSWKTGGQGSTVIRALQKKIGTSADGLFGPNSCRALQKYLGTPVDGYISGPSVCVRKLQERLNSNNL